MGETVLARLERLIAAGRPVAEPNEAVGRMDAILRPNRQRIEFLRKQAYDRGLGAGWYESDPVDPKYEERLPRYITYRDPKEHLTDIRAGIGKEHVTPVEGHAFGQEYGFWQSKRPLYRAAMESAKASKAGDFAAAKAAMPEGLSEEDRGHYLRFVREHLQRPWMRAKNPEGVIGKFATSIGLGVRAAKENIRFAASRLKHGAAAVDLALAREQGLPSEPERAEAYGRAGEEYEREFAVKGMAGAAEAARPRLAEGIGGAAVYGLGRQLPLIAPAVVAPHVGIPWMATQIGTDTAVEFKQMGMSDENAWLGGMVAGTAEAVLEYMQVDAAKKLLLGAPMRRGVLAAVRRIGGAYLLQVAEEGTQSAAGDLTKRIMSEVDENVKGLDWSKPEKELWRAFKEDFAKAIDEMVASGPVLALMTAPGAMAQMGGGVIDSLAAGDDTRIDALRALAEKTAPSRKDMVRAGITKQMSKGKRMKFAAALRRRVALDEQAEEVARAGEAEEGPVPGGEEAGVLGPEAGAVRVRDTKQTEETARQEALEPPETRPETPSPPEEVPPVETMPEAAEPNDARIGDLLDNWFANKDERTMEANIDAANLQDQVMAIVGEKRYGPKSKALDRAILVNVDLRGKEGQYTKYSKDLTADQKETFALSQDLPPAAQAVANEIVEMNRLSGEEALDEDVIRNVHENYIMRLYEQQEGKPLTSKKFAPTTERAKQRTLESILHAWAIGKKLKVSGATEAMRVARQQVGQAIEDRNLIKMAVKAGLVSTEQGEGWTRIEHPNFSRWVPTGQVAVEGKTYGKNFFVTEDGTILERQAMYAEPTLAKKLNNILGASKLKGTLAGATDVATKLNATIKQTILFTSLFHHQAFLRSYMLAGRGLNPFTGYAKGQEAIRNFVPELRELVRGGMTLGEIQDWDETALREKTRIGEVIDKVPMAREVKDALVDLRERQTDYLFKRLGPNLKAQAGLLEYRHLLKTNRAKLESGEITRHDLAKTVANLMNDDFGGLHLGRLARNPTTQHIFRLLSLAPDWTESNVRSMVKAFKIGREGAVYRRMWGRVLLKGMGTTILFNLALSFADEDDFWTRYQKAWKEGRLRWLDVDVTPIYRMLGGDRGKRKYFSLIGHFRDPIKFVGLAKPGGYGGPDPFFAALTSAKHKGSVLSRVVLDIITGSDWAGRGFTTFAELVGIDEKGKYKTNRPGYYRRGAPKGGKLRGRLVGKTRGPMKPVGVEEIPSLALYETRSATPIQVQNLIAWLSGEMDAFDAITKSLGLMTSTTYPERGKRRAP